MSTFDIHGRIFPCQIRKRRGGDGGKKGEKKGKKKEKNLLYLDINWPLLFFTYGVKTTSTFKSSFNGLYAMPNYMH